MGYYVRKPIRFSTYQYHCSLSAHCHSIIQVESVLRWVYWLLDAVIAEFGCTRNKVPAITAVGCHTQTKSENLPSLDGEFEKLSHLTIEYNIVISSCNQLQLAKHQRKTCFESQCNRWSDGQMWKWILVVCWWIVFVAPILWTSILYLFEWRKEEKWRNKTQKRNH